MTTKMKKILIVEDDANLGISLKKICDTEGFQTSLATNLAEARHLIANAFDLIVLDWMLSDGQGIDFLKELRRHNQATPVIMLTARTDLIDKVIGLESGSNDYMTKPFESRELVARIRVQLRDKGSSTTNQTEDRFVLGKLAFDTKAHEFFFENKKVTLTKMEYDLLKLLAENPRQTFSRENLLDKVWGYENYPTTRTVDNHVLQIRQKTNDDIIETIRGLGYRLGIVSSN